MDTDKNLHKILKGNGLPVAFKSSSKPNLTSKDPEKLKNTNKMIPKLLNKKKIINNEDCKLPNLGLFFSESGWQVDQLQVLKLQLNEMKSHLNDFNLKDWKKHTQRRNFASAIKRVIQKEVNPELSTQAWCKFYECLSRFPLISNVVKNKNKLRSIHLCEAPGAFVTALNHFLRLNQPTIDWDWTATTLNPHYEGNSLSMMVNEDILIKETLEHWFFGADFTGNLMSLENLDHLVGYQKMNREDILLITADGSINCNDTPDEQEILVSQLHFCEVVTAFHLLQKDGSFLIKLFTIYEHQTICLVYLLACCFNSLTVVKPATSKEGNSEVYLVCLGFKGSEFIEPYLPILRRHFESRTKFAMLPKSSIPQSFINQIISIGEFFKNLQSEVICFNIQSYHKTRGYTCKCDPGGLHILDTGLDTKFIGYSIGKRFVKLYKIKRIYGDLQILGPKFTMKSLINFDADIKHLNQSYNDNQKFHQMSSLEQLMILIKELNVNPKKFSYIISNETIGDTPLTQTRIQTLEKPNLLIIGAPFTRVLNSKFCQSNILTVYNNILDVMSQFRLKWEMDLNSNEIKRELAEKKTKVLTFDFNSCDNSAMKTLNSALIDFPKGSNLSLIGFPTLTQYNVNFLKILFKSFDKVEVSGSANEMSVIKLKDYLENSAVIKQLNNIVEMSEEAKSKGKMMIARLLNLQKDNVFLAVNQQNIKKITDDIVQKIQLIIN